MSEDSALMAEWLKLAGYAVLDGFDNEADIAGKFEVDPARVRGVIAALYGHESYDGRAFVLLVREGKLYEVNGSHCSCYGLEGQWEEEDTSVAALRLRTWPSDIYSNNTDEQMKRLLDLLEVM